MTLADFLYMHYVANHESDADYDKDQRLPFKTHDSNTGLSVGLFPLSDTAVALIHYPSSSNKHGVIVDGLYSSAHLSAIWQPPKRG